MALKTWNEWRKQAPTFLEEAEEFRKWASGEDVVDDDDDVEPAQSSIELTEEEWLEIKGIGPKLAKRFVESGPLDLEEIGQMKGVRQAVIENIKTFLDERSTPETA